MDAPANVANWDLIAAFLAVADAGSLSAAARVTGRSQPTLGRQVKALEAQLGAELFYRQARGLVLTEAGLELLEPACAMREAAQHLALMAAGQSQRIDGTVRLTASVYASHHILPRILAGIRAEEPGIQIDLVATDATENLLFREADIAVRMYRPAQLDVVSTHLGDLPLGAFAARAYLDRVGRPKDLEGWLALDFVGYDRNDLILQGMRANGILATRDFFAVRTDQQAVYWELVRAGCGVGFTQLYSGRSDPLVEEVPLPMQIEPLPVWLAAPDAMRRTPRIARVWRLLKSHLSRYMADSAAQLG